MQMKRCYKCGSIISDEVEYCPECGAKLTKRIVSVGGLKFTPWDIAFILICNISFVLIMTNIFVGQNCWCHYPVLGMFAVYFIAFSLSSNTAKKFLTRIRNTAIMLNFVSGVFALVCNALSTGNTQWVFDYFIPINIIVVCSIMLFMLLCPEIHLKTVMFSILLLSVQSLTQFVLMLCKVTATEAVSKILVSVAFGVNIISLVNLIFIYFIKHKNMVVEKFRLWE